MDLMKQGKVTITSNVIAELTGKLHKTVMRDIRVIIENIGAKEICTEVAPSTYKDKANREKPNFVLTKEFTDKLLSKYNLNSKPKKSNLLYLLKADKYYKIGVTRNLVSRIKSIQTGCMFEVEVEETWLIDDPTKTERQLHKIFKNKRMTGEWFELNEEDVLFIKDRSSKCQ